MLVVISYLSRKVEDYHGFSHIQLFPLYIEYIFFFNPLTLLPHPVWHGFHSAPGCRWCTPRLSSSCPTSGTEPAPPSHPPGYAGAPQCTSAAH